MRKVVSPICLRGRFWIMSRRLSRHVNLDSLPGSSQRGKAAAPKNLLGNLVRANRQTFESSWEEPWVTTNMTYITPSRNEFPCKLGHDYLIFISIK